LETGVKYLFILKRVTESSVTALWNRQIITAHTQFDVYEYLDDKFRNSIINIKFNIFTAIITLE